MASWQQDEPPATPDSVTRSALTEHGSPQASLEHERAVTEALGEVARELAVGVDRDTVLRGIAEHVRRLCPADLVVLAVSDESAHDARVVARAGPEGAAHDGAVFRANDPGPVGQALATGIPVVADCQPDPCRRPEDAVGAEAMRAVAAVPLRAGNRTEGLLLAYRRRADPFRPGEIAMIEVLARHAALAVRFASLRETAEARAAEVAVLQDRTLEQLRASQERLVRAERLRALGEMANGVAHDFNNLLAVILGRAQLLMLRTEDREVRRGLSVIEAAATEAAQTIRRIHEFTRTRQSRAYVPVDLAEVLRQAVDLTKGRWKGEAQVDGVAYAITTDIPPMIRVPGDAVELRELFANLLLNAFDAMRDGGSVAIAARAAGGDHVVVEVRDTGPGMPPDVRERVFEPFFTTKGPRRTGLGLSVAYGITQRHRGSIEVDSQEGRGTTFTVTLPLVETAEGEAPETGQPLLRPVRPARVLVIEDEPMVGEVLVDLLRSAGHVPRWATDGPAGLGLIDPAAPPDIALVDLGLPGMSGLEVAGRIQAAHPQVPIVLVTGWADRIDPEAVRRSGISQVVAKPFRTEEILRIVAAAVDQPGPAGSPKAPRP